MQILRRCGREDRPAMLEVINAAASAYEGVIPDDCWRSPYMRIEELDEEIADGVEFSGVWADNRLCGVMGVQDRGEVTLIRHAYVRPAKQGQGVGGALLGRFCDGADKPVLVGTWAAADWAVRFYERHGFARTAPEEVPRLLAAYWSVSARQAQASVVLARPATTLAPAPEDAPCIASR